MIVTSTLSTVSFSTGRMLMRIARSTTAFRAHEILRAGLGVFALLMLGAIVAENAQASCGDYLVIGGAGHDMDQSSEAPAAAASQPPLRTPCNGPQCRQSPGIPSPPLPTASGPGQHERANIQRLSDFNLPSPFWYCVVESSARAAAGFPFRLERPPHC